MRFYTARVTTSLSKPPCERPAPRPEADTLNRMVRALFTPPERRFFKPDPLPAPSNPLNYRAFNIRTKMAVVRLLRRKWAERTGKRPEVGLLRGPGGSDKWPGLAAFCGVPAGAERRKKSVPSEQAGGAVSLMLTGLRLGRNAGS